jgi:phosphatidylglycerol---prolipoprotein diacylglyceryl transferase
MYPVIAHLGPVTLYSYGLMMALAFLAAGYLTGQELERKGFNGEIASSMVFWAAVGGLLGSRVLAIFDDWSGFLAAPMHALLSGAGFVFYGGLVGGCIAVTWVIRKNQLPWLVAVDCIAPGLVLAQGIGRIGCELAGDGDWGRETTLPWGRSYPNAIVGWPYPPDVRVHPTPLYETLAYTLIFGLLWSLRKRPYADGTIFWCYLVLAPTARFLIEFLRINPRILLDLTQAQWISLVLVAVGSWRLLSGWGATQVAAPASAAKR